VLAENRFLAARDGVAARLIDPTAESLRPITEILVELLDAVSPHATALGCLTELEWISALVAAPGAARQRDHPGEEDRLEGLVASLAAAFTE
jgi:carboxylate-amine ligase